MKAVNTACVRCGFSNIMLKFFYNGAGCAGMSAMSGGTTSQGVYDYEDWALLVKTI